MKPGTRFGKVRAVTPEVTAAAFDGDMLPVLATPYLIAFMEEVAAACVAPELEPGQITLGTMVNMRHLSATPVGMNVTCEATLTAVDRRRLTFDVRAWDEAGPVGEGTHERFIVDCADFIARVNAKHPGVEPRTSIAAAPGQGPGRRLLSPFWHRVFAPLIQAQKPFPGTVPRTPIATAFLAIRPPRRSWGGRLCRWNRQSTAAVISDHPQRTY